MTNIAGAVALAEPEPGLILAREQVRGSSLLLAGRGLSLAVNFAVQVLVVRYLSTRDFGALVYTLTVVYLLGNVATLGLRNGLARFVPLYAQRRDMPRLWGLLVLVVGGTLAASFALIAIVYTMSQFFGAALHSQQSLELLLIFVLLVPLEALDAIAIELFASLFNARAIFLRRHVLASMLKLMVVAAVVMLQADLHVLAWSSVAATAVGLAINVAVLVRMLRGQPLLERIELRRIVLPVRELFAFTLPLLSSDLMFIAVHAAGILMLGYFHDTARVALYRVAMPLANLNSAIMASFAVLYLPLAARLLARRDEAALHLLYWKAAAWVAVLSFPIFAMTYGLAGPLITLIYGERYGASAILLQVLAIAMYFNVALGFNGLTLRLLGRTRFVVMIDVFTIILVLGLDVLFVPRHGALAAAVAAAIGLVAHNLLAQWGLWSVSLGFVEHRVRRLYASLAIFALVVVASDYFGPGKLIFTLPAVAACSLAVVVLSKRALQLEGVFPELACLPLVGRAFRGRIERDAFVLEPAATSFER